MDAGKDADLRTRIIAHVLEEGDVAFLTHVEQLFVRRATLRSRTDRLEPLDDEDIDAVLARLKGSAVDVGAG